MYTDNQVAEFNLAPLKDAVETVAQTQDTAPFQKNEKSPTSTACEFAVKAPPPAPPTAAKSEGWTSKYFKKYDPKVLTHALTDLSPAIRAVIESKVLKTYEITDAPVGLFYDMDLFDAHLAYFYAFVSKSGVCCVMCKTQDVSSYGEIIHF